MEQGKPPNILLIISDEHAAATMGCTGGAAITPNMDRLAATGTTFSNAYCNFALCVPSRASFMTGLLPHRINAFDNGSPLAANFPTWAHMLGACGYTTILNGKMHFIGEDRKHGFHEHWNEKRHPVSGYRWGEERPDRTGYRHWSEPVIVPSGQNHPHIDTDIERCRRAADFIRTKGTEEPWCMTVGFRFPHYPLVCSRDAYDLYADADIPLPFSRHSSHPRNRHWAENVWGFDRFPPERIPVARRAYLSMVSMLDGWIGNLIETVEKAGAAGRTLVIYTSDHGDMWGEHGMWGKNLFYEESARVPMILCGPELGVKQGGRIEAPVSLVDIYPTLRDVCRCSDWQLQLDGESLWDACRGAGEPGQRPVFCEYYSSDTKGPERMIRLGRWKLNYYHRQGIELYDLENDPHELKDVSGEPATAQVRRRLMGELTRDWDAEALDERIRADQNRRALISESRKPLRRCAGHQAL